MTDPWKYMRKKLGVNRFEPDYSIGFSFTINAPQPTLEDTLADQFEEVIEEEDDEVEHDIIHEPQNRGAITLVMAKLRIPDVRENEVWLYTDTSKSYTRLIHHAHPHDTVEVMNKMLAGWTWEEATRGN